MAKNVIIMIGDGFGWEMARAGAIQAQVEAEIAELQAQGLSNEAIAAVFQDRTLDDYYTEGKGSGLSVQELENYQIATTSSTYIDGDTGNSALQGDPFDHNTGKAPVREGFEFNPTAATSVGIENGGEVNDDPVLDENGNIVGGNLHIFDTVAGGATPWDANYYENRGSTAAGFDDEYIKNIYPDSANTATTLYTGVKSYSGAIGVDIFEQAVETLAEQALSIGKSAGVVSSVPYNHATPAAAVAHVNQRNKYTPDSVEAEVDEYGNPIEDYDNIFSQIVEVVKPTVVLGGGHPLTGAGERYTTEENLNELRNGVYDYTFLERAPGAAETLAETAAGLDPDDGDRLFGIYGARGQGGNLPWRTANDDYSQVGIDYNVGTNKFTTRPLEEGETDAEFIAREIDENPNLADLTKAALDVLGSDDQGFWLSIEGGDIDWSAHANDLDANLGTVKAFDESVQATKEWIAANGGWEENLLIVTADHDHYLTLLDNYPEVLAQELLSGAGGFNLTNELDPATVGHFWGSDETDKNGWTTHTTRPVPVYFQGAGAEVLASYAGQGFDSYGKPVEGISDFIDQAHIGLASTQALFADVEPLAELVDLTGIDGDVSVNVTVEREAAFDNVLKFYQTDALGRVGGLRPGQAGYEEAVAANLLDAELFVTNNTASDLNLTLTGGTYYAPALLIDGSLTNLATIEDNALGSIRVQRNGNVWGFEDLTDNDFNDLVVTINSVEPVAA